MPQVASGKNHADLFLVEQLVNSDVRDMILPITTPPSPMIVLVGPPGSGQKKLIQEFYEKNNRYLQLGVSHTTRPRNFNEIEGLSYYFVSEEKFEDMVRNAEFVTVSSILGFAYGFSYKELMKCTEQKAVLILHTDLVGALNLRMRNLRPFLVLTLFSESDSYYSGLLKKYCYAYWLDRNYKALRIIDDSSKMHSSSNDIENILKQIITNITESDTKTRKSLVKFREQEQPILFDNVVYSESTSYDSYIEEESKEDSDEMICLIAQAKKLGSGFISDFKEDDIFYSISEVEFDFEPILSTASDDKTEEDYDAEEGIHRINKRLKPSQRIGHFIDDILTTREEYVEFHRKNPGIFCETLFTDKQEETVRKLDALLKMALKRLTAPWHSYKFETDSSFEEMISHRLNGLHADMRNYFK